MADLNYYNHAGVIDPIFMFCFVNSLYLVGLSRTSGGGWLICPMMRKTQFKKLQNGKCDQIVAQIQ